ncbi:phage tail protein [Rubrivirga sp. IMCC45206]|uniref:phage tail protein n=1 Tax=Rubrivirga sp. IMCC45206 TaxID=3391614 RepID=UPI00398F8E84
MSLFSSLRPPRPDADPGRRSFFRRATAFGAAAVGGTFLASDTSWAAVESRARGFGITPGTVVDARGRPLASGGVTPYLGEIMACGWNFAARGFALCDGQLLPVASHTALFSLLGTMYGGDGRTTFGLPDLRGRVALGWGHGPGLSSNDLGEKRGAETLTLTTANLPSHHHAHSHAQPVDNSPGTALAPGGNVPAGDHTGDQIYAPPSDADASFAPTSADETNTGGGQSFSIMPPTIVLNYQIALQGQFPLRN